MIGGRIIGIAGCAATATLALWIPTAEGAATVTCSSAAGVFSVSASAGTSTSSSTIDVSVSSGSYVVTSGGATVTGACAGVSISSDKTLALASTAGSQYFVVDDGNGQLASSTAGCPVGVTTSGLASTASTVQITEITSPSSVANGSAAVDNGQNVTVSEGGCVNPDLLLAGNAALAVVGSGSTSSTLDLSPDVKQPLTLTANGDSAANPGTVVGFSSGGFTSLTFQGIATVDGPTKGASNFRPGSNGGSAETVTFAAAGSGNVFTASGDTAPSGADVRMAGSGLCAGKSEFADVFNGIDVCFTGITTVAGANGPTDFALDSETGLTFDGFPGQQNTANLIQMPASGAAPLNVNFAAVTPTVSSGTTTYASIIGIGVVFGSASGNTTFRASGTAGAYTFHGVGSGGNQLDMSAVTASGAQPMVINPTSSVAGPASPNSVTFGTGQQDTFSGMNDFKGSPSGFTRMISDFGINGLTFNGLGGIGNTLDLSSALGSSGPVLIDPTAGTVTQGPTTEHVSGFQTFVGGPGNTAFKAPATPGTTFNGSGVGNSVDASELPADAANPLTIDDTGTIRSGATTYLTFASVSSFQGSAGGNTTLLAKSGLSESFIGAGSGDAVDFSGESGSAPLAINAATGSSTIGAATISASGVNTYTGLSAGNTTFNTGSATGLTFTGKGAGNTLNLSGESATSGMPLVVSGAAGTASAGATTDATFAGVQTIDGSGSGFTTFQPGTATGVAFTGLGSAGNVLDLTGETGFSGLTAAINADSAGTPGHLTSTGGSPDIADTFSNVQTVTGATAVPTTFQPGSASGLTFAGGDRAAGGAVLDLTAEPSSSFTGFRVAMGGGGACTVAGEGRLTATGSSALTDCFSGVSSVHGATAVPTTFQPDQNLTSTPGAIPVFTGGDTASGGSVVDLTGFTSPDASSQTVSNLKVSLGANTAGNPGAVAADVGANRVTFADFHGITGVLGATAIPTALDPGTASGVNASGVTAPTQPLTSQQIKFTSAPPSGGGVIGSTYTVTATGGGSGNPVTFSIDAASTTGACTIAGAMIHFAAAGACVVDANQAAGPGYAAALQAEQAIGIPAPAPHPQAQAPVLSGLHLIGTTLVVTLSQAATITVTISARIAGRGLAHGACRAGARRGTKCTLVERRTQPATGVAGGNVIALGTRGLPPGRYAVTISARSSAGLTSNGLGASLKLKR